MSTDDPLLHFDLRPTTDEGVTVRFPPGLGLIPPRDVPRPHKARPPTEWVA